jgi:hypothetical protein
MAESRWLLDHREIPLVLEQRPSGLLETPTFLGALQGADLGTTDLIQRVLDQPLNVKAVEHDLRLRRPGGDGLDVCRGHVHGDALELGGPLGPQGVEEAPDCRDILALGHPDHTLLDVVDDHGQVLVMPPVRQLVDADVLQSIEQLRLTAASHHALNHGAHGPPGDPHRLGHRGLVASLGEVGDVVLEISGVARFVLRPRHQLGNHPASAAVNPPEVVSQRDLHPAEVQVAPGARPLVVDPAPGGATPRAPRQPGGRSDVHLQPVRPELGTDDAGLFHRQELAE